MFNIFEDSVSKFIKANSKAVIATVDSENQPSTSMIFYVVDGNEIYFITKSQTTKFINAESNSKSALTIFDKDKPIAVNITGFVQETKDQAKRDEIMKRIFQLSYSELHDYSPIIKLHKGSFSVLSFTPKQAKMTDFTQPMGKAKEDLKNF
jgi:uncharacterized pyridoxamine 5'-phosphate oxidase family protein